MAKKTDTKKEELVAIDVILSTNTLRELEHGEQGQYIKLVDIEDTKTILKKLAKKYEPLVITKENYKKEGMLAEKDLRQNRYALQKIHKGNNKFINDTKKAEKELYDGLIEEIQPIEERIYNDISAFKTLEKEEKERAEKEEAERLAKIEGALKEAEFSLEKAIVKGKTQDDLQAYDDFLREFKEKFSEFGELEFQAKRLHAIYTARRSELETQVNQFTKEAIEKKEREAKEKKREEQKGRILEARKKTLLNKGLEVSGENYTGFDIALTEDEIKDLDELEWLDLSEEIDTAIQKVKDEKIKTEKKEKEEKKKKEKEDKEKAEQDEKDALIKARKDWEDLVVVYKDLGGDGTLWKLKKGVVPNEREVLKLAKATRQLQADKKAKKLKGVKGDLLPFEQKAKKFIIDMMLQKDETDFKNVESVTIIDNFLNNIDKVIIEVFSE